MGGCISKRSFCYLFLCFFYCDMSEFLLLKIHLCFRHGYVTSVLSCKDSFYFPFIFHSLQLNCTVALSSNTLQLKAKAHCEYRKYLHQFLYHNISVSLGKHLQHVLSLYVKHKISASMQRLFGEFMPMVIGDLTGNVDVFENRKPLYQCVLSVMQM